jgi:hypothetical protein
MSSLVTRRLLQMGSIERLPTVIFQLIQQFVLEKEYRHLMSCRKETFSSIKHETVTYSLCLNGTREEPLRRLIVSVKDKSKQISVTFQNMNQFAIIKYVNICSGIENISIYVSPYNFERHVTIGNYFPFRAFNNILHLTVEGIPEISKASLFLEKTTKLTLVKCLNLKEVITCNSEHVLQGVIIRDCNSLEILPPLQNIPEVSISSQGRQCHSFRVGKQKKLSYEGWAPSFETLQTMSKEITFHESVVELKLNWFTLPTTFTDFSWCRNISVLELSAVSGDRLRFPPVFSGQQLKLARFNLSDWSERQCFPNLERCHLTSCNDLGALPEMPMVTHLTVFWSFLPILPSFPALTCLRLNNAVTLTSPNLTEAEISNCYYLEDVTGLDRVSKLKIHSCNDLIAIPSLPNVKKLEICECSNLCDLQQLTREWSIDYFEKKRVVCLSELQTLNEFSFCQKIYSLELVRLSLLKNCQGIGNIHNLTIQWCGKLTSTEGLGKVTGRLVLKDSCSLQILKDLKNIPKVEIQKCNEVSDFTGLGNHESLLVRGCRNFTIFFEEYRNEQKHQDIFSTICNLL